MNNEQEPKIRPDSLAYFHLLFQPGLDWAVFNVPANTV